MPRLLSGMRSLPSVGCVVGMCFLVGVSLKGQEVAKMQNVLKSVETRLPELQMTSIRPYGNTVTAMFADRGASKDSPGKVIVVIESYSSVDESDKGLQKSLMTTSVVPTSKELYKDLTIYKWGDGRLLCRVGPQVVNIDSTKGQAIMLKVLDSLVLDLPTSKR